MLLPAESLLAQEFGVLRPTIAKVYEALISEGLLCRKRGVDTIVSKVVHEPSAAYTFGLLLPGAGESEIFAEINNQILKLAELGYCCGSDYLLSGFDNMKYSGFVKTPLTTYAQPCTEIADVSIELLMRRLQRSDSHPLTVLLGGQLVERASTSFSHP